MAKYQVIAGIYKDGRDESEEEEVLLDTDDRIEAEEFLSGLVSDSAADDDDVEDGDPEDVDE